MNLSRHVSILVLMMLPLLAGCRMYGGYGTVDAHRDAIAAEIDQASDELQDARRSLDRMMAAAAADAGVSPYAARYEALVERHAALVEEYIAREDELQTSGGYRFVSRALGAMLAEQARIMAGYEAVELAAARYLDADGVMLADNARQYAVYPAVYYDWWHQRSAAEIRSILDAAR